MRIAVCGLGFMGATHIKAITASPSVTLAAVVSSDPKKLAGDFSGVGGNLDTTSEAIDLSAVKKYSTIEEALADPEIDAVDLCLPTYLHAPQAIAALAAGKHVLIEKPMALSGADCDAIIAAAKAADRVVMCAQVLRFFPMYSVLPKDKPRAARFRRRCAAPGWGAWLKDKSRSGGGVFDLLIHDVDLMIHLYGSPQSVTATGYEDLAAGVDLIDAQFQYDGFSVSVSGGWHPGAYPFSMEYTIVTAAGTYDYSFPAGDPVFYAPGAEPQVLTPPEPVDGYRAQIEYFAQCASQNQLPADCLPETSAEAVRWTIQMEEARWK
ncbi:MAG: Gfo/Idh/MocA family oxidoreductase [Acidobacteria bacterium]|nr:Gfo/Idh/MocA family oxidoreductase [Acidobacteriota bacterium]